MPSRQRRVHTIASSRTVFITDLAIRDEQFDGSVGTRVDHFVTEPSVRRRRKEPVIRSRPPSPRMPKFIIEPHFRLQEWVAEEKGYFREEGLDHEFKEFIRASGGAHHVKAGKTGGFQSIEKGREANVTCARHWTVNVAASRGHTKLYADAYSVAPCGIFVAADSPVKTPADLADVPISVGYQSGSHYATVQALEQYMAADRIKL